MPAPAQVQPNSVQTSPDPNYPDWLAQMDAAPPSAVPLPDNVQLDGVPPPSATVLPPGVQLDGVPPAASDSNYPAWLATLDAQNAPPAATAQPDGWKAVGENALTGLAKVPGAIAGVGPMLEHTRNWMNAQEQNAYNYGAGDSKRVTGADLDAQDPLMQIVSKEAQVIGDAPFQLTGTTPYQPQTPGGQVGQAAVTGLGAGLLDPAADWTLVKQAPTVLKALFQAAKNQAASAAKTAIASGAAQGTQQVLPDTPGLAAAAALLTHAGTSGAMAAARSGGGLAADAARQVVTPTSQGVREAGRVVAKTDLSLPGIANPTPSDVAAGVGNVRAATDDIGPGQQPWQAGAQLRAGLQQRVDSLAQARTDATAPLLEARDTSPTLINTDPVLALIGKKLNVAAGPQQDALQGALADLHLADGSPREDAAQLAAARTALNSRISTAARSGDTASASHLLDVRNALDTQINAAVPEAGQYTSTYADMSKPLDPAQYGPVAKVLDRDQYNSRYTLPDERVPDLFLRSNATRTDLNQLIAAHGGDRTAALGSLQDHLAGTAQGAVQPDGTLDTVAFDKAMAPYQRSLGNLGVWFPELNQKFSTAKAAQGTLDTLNAQRGLADAISGGALRDASGMVTGPSFGKWLRSNQNVISQTQSPGAAMRLQSFASALQNAQPGELADVLKSEWAPTALGVATGGLEGGVLGTLLHKSTQAAFGSLDAKRQAAFSSAMERAVTDSDYASRLAATASKRGDGLSPTRALVRAIAATPIAVNAAGRGAD